MSANLIDGKALSQKILSELATEVQSISSTRQPGLAVLQLGDDPASAVYVNNKIRACEKVGIVSQKILLASDTTEATLLAQIQNLNEDPTVDGILVQLPLPKTIDTYKVIDAITPHKDVDGFHPYNLGCLAQRRPALRPCTPYGVTHLLESIQYDFKKGRMVIVGASNIVGRPMALEALIKGATPTICHRFTDDLPSLVSEADCLIVAVGKPGIVKSEWIKPGAVIIDVGINRLEDGSLSGDCEFDSARERASWITPVPGGVGPMTVAMLMKNTIEAFKKSVA